MRSAAVAARKKIDRVFLTWFTRCIHAFARLVPYRLGIWSGAILGIAAFALLRRERTRALAHLAVAFPGADSRWIRSTAKNSFRHLGISLMETMLMTPERVARSVRIEGKHNLQKALKQGRGVVYVAAHIGNWELMAQAVAALAPLSVVAAPIEPEQVNDMIVRLRADRGVRTILRGRPGASREFIRAFRENRILGLLIDQDTDVESAFVDFMGRPAWTPTAAASMAIKFGAPVVFGWIHRDADNTHTVRIEGPIELARTGNDDRDIVANTALFTAKIEAAIRRKPEQWVWMHRRWRRQP